MSKSHEIDCWKCGEQSTLKIRSEFDGCCWACGAEIDLEDYLARAMDERDQLRAEVEALCKDAEVSAADTNDAEREVEALRSLLASSREFVATYVSNSFFGANAKQQLKAIDAAMAAKDGQP